MNTRMLGGSEIRVPRICFGGNVLGWTADKETSFAMLDRLFDAGLNFIDTADAYSAWVPGHQGGESETIIGEWSAARGNRDKVIIATKVGAEIISGRKGLSRSYITQAIEASLRRLKTDYIDIYQSHRDDPDTPIEETLEAFAKLITAGKVRAIGASNFTAGRLEEARTACERNGWPRYEVVQPQYNLFDRMAFEVDIAPFCLAHDVGAICYYGLAHGFLSGKYRKLDDLAGRPRAAPLQRYFTPRGLAILDALAAIADGHGAESAQVALAWLAERSGVTAAIASATNIGQADALAVAARLVLSQSEIETLDRVSTEEMVPAT